MRIGLSTGRRIALAAVVLALGTQGAAADAAAQATDRPIGGSFFVGSEMDRYLRVLMVTGLAEPYPVSLRAYAIPELDRILGREGLGNHPWSAATDLRPRGEGAFGVGWVDPEGRIVFNSTYPYGVNEGVVWSGRGTTAAARGGVFAWAGPFTAQLAPEAFIAGNADFRLRETGVSDLPFADPREPTRIDAPQRFGDGAYGRIDPGQSYLRLDLLGIAAGVSTANQQWGPGERYPFLMGPNAPGYRHLFLGTSRPVSIGIGRVHGRMVWGELAQSDYTRWEGLDAQRFSSSAVLVFMPAVLTGLEVGGARTFHLPWREEGPAAEDFLRPIEAFWRQIRGDGPTFSNQLASAFFRWTFPDPGFEVWGEVARNDHSYNLRDFLLEPDHDFGYLLGLRRVWRLDSGMLIAVSGEVMNAQRTHLAIGRTQVPFYRHSRLRQGHTHRGQILGSPAAYGGAGAHLGVDVYPSWGRWSVRWERTLRDDGQSRRAPGSAVETRESLWDVEHALLSEGLVRVGAFSVHGGLGVVRNFNRYLESDAMNVRIDAGVRLGL